MKFILTQSVIISLVFLVKQIQSTAVAVNRSLQGGQCNLPNLNCEEATSNPCNDFDVEFCENVNCIDACQGTDFDESIVGCQGDEACSGATFRRTEVNCNGPDSCLYAKMHKSAVTCPLADPFGSCRLATWFHCNCCMPGSESCQDDIPLCFDPQTGSAEEFCSSSFLGRTCKDWGNPVCDDVAVESLPPLHAAENCTAQTEIVECEALKESCSGFQFDSCAVNCVDACQGGEFESSTVACQGNESCGSATFRETVAGCLGPDSCLYAKLHTSAVMCPLANPWGSCRLATWFHCNCCMPGSESCQDDIPLCYDPQTDSAQEFCSSTFLGRTCKDWGNPICVDVPGASLDPIHPAETCSPAKEDIVHCEVSKESCNAFQFDSCTVNCIDACEGGEFQSSTVACQGDKSCDSATFRETYIGCLGPDSCLEATFFASAVFCPLANPWGSCRLATWNQCSCCLGGNSCPDDVPLCTNPQTDSSDEFCNTVVEGRTCKDWGNPICSIKTTIPPTLPPTFPYSDSPPDADADSGARIDLLLLNTVSKCPILIYFFIDFILF